MRESVPGIDDASEEEHNNATSIGFMSQSLSVGGVIDGCSRVIGTIIRLKQDGFQTLTATVRTRWLTKQEHETRTCVVHGPH